MADDGSAQPTTTWPLPRFRFEVKRDGAVMRFQEVSGLDTESRILEYRHGDEAQFSPLKMPGNEVAVETIVISHEGLSVGNG